MDTPARLDHRWLTGIGARRLWLRAEGHPSLSPVARPAGQELATELRALGTEVEFPAGGTCATRRLRTLVIGPWRASGAWIAAVNNAGTEGQPGPYAGRPPTRMRDLRHQTCWHVLSMNHELADDASQGAQHRQHLLDYGTKAAASVYGCQQHRRGMTKSAALEAAASACALNAVRPARLRPPCHPLHRHCGEEGRARHRSAAGARRQPDRSVAPLCSASAEASFVTGHVLAADGARARAKGKGDPMSTLNEKVASSPAVRAWHWRS